VSTKTSREITVTSPVPNLLPPTGNLGQDFRDLSQYTPPRRGRLGKNHNNPGFRLGEHIRELITLRGLTRQQVADRSGVSTYGLNHIVGGYVKIPSIETLMGLAKALDVSTLELLAYTGAVDEQDITSYVASHMQSSVMAEDSAWKLAGKELQDLPLEKRKVLLQTILVLISSHKAYCQTED